MNKSRETVIRIGLLRWEMLSIVSVIVLLLLAWYIVYPVIFFQWEQSAAISKEINFLKTEDMLPEKSYLLRISTIFLPYSIDDSTEHPVTNGWS